MNFTSNFESHFQDPKGYIETDLDLNAKLQNTRHALQESLSENDQLIEIINQLYSESRVENVAVSELLSEVSQPLFRNISLPRNADNLPASERAGYVMYYMKFLGFATRKSMEEYHKTKEHLEGMHKSVRTNTSDPKIVRTGILKVPELDGEKEIKRSTKAKPPLSPPVTPPKEIINSKQSK